MKDAIATRLPAAPSALRCSRLEAPPAVAWRHISHSRFLAAYLGAELPDAALDRQPTLQGRDRDGVPLHLRITRVEPPSGLSLILRSSAGCEVMHLSLAACEGGSRLTVLHEPLVDETTATATRTGTATALGTAADTEASTDAVHALLSSPLTAALRTPAIADDAALAAARSFLADSALGVERLRAVMAADQGYAKPAPDRFSLAEHLWHLADVETFGWSQRLLRVLAEREPVLAGVDGDRLAIERRYQQRPWRGAARRFVGERRRSLGALARFDGSTLLRPVRFGGRRISAGELLAAMLAHDHEHRLEMAALWPPAAASADEGQP
jgi:uncharacterized protein YndB with AHSA1/START domain